MKLELILFSHDVTYAATAIRAGFDAVVVDWEHAGKSERQIGHDTEINAGNAEHLTQMRRATSARLICRINNTPELRRDDLIKAADCGADEILLPMVRSIGEVDDCLAGLPSGCRLGVMIETKEALTLGHLLRQRPLARAFVGLNDLAINRATPNLFSSLVDGTIDTFRAGYDGHLAVAGVTRPECGDPIPCRLLIAKMAHLRCTFAVARRSFRADVPIHEISNATTSIRQFYRDMSNRPAIDEMADLADLKQQVEALAGTSR